MQRVTIVKHAIIQYMKTFLQTKGYGIQKKMKMTIEWVNTMPIHYWIVGLLILIGAGIRLYKFGAIPAGLHRDEASL